MRGEAPDHPRAVAFLYEVRPLPMVATWLAMLLGVLYAPGTVDAGLVVLYGIVVGSALYAGHAVDSYVDYHVRGEEKFVYMGIFEDSGGLLGPGDLLGAAAVATGVFAFVLWQVTDPGSILFIVSLLGWVVAASYSPVLDQHPVTVSLAYPTGTTLALVGGALLAGGAAPGRLAALAVPVLLYLVGGKVVSDLIDHDLDVSMGKRTAVVVLGKARGRALGYGICVLGLVAALGAVGVGVLPWTALLGVAAAAGALVWSRGMPPHRATLTIVAGGYVFLASCILPAVL